MIEQSCHANNQKISFIKHTMFMDCFSFSLFLQETYNCALLATGSLLNVVQTVLTGQVCIF